MPKKPKVKKPTLREKLDAKFNQGVDVGRRGQVADYNTKYHAGIEKRRLAFYTFQGSVNGAINTALKTLIETLDSIDRSLID